uniref:Uncharacterized protein n=1 Tax=Amphiprion percula TaxID=161767 RepID=A0A3P8SUC8_AMPPE
MTTGEEPQPAGSMKVPGSVTTLSTIAVQAGRSLIIVSILKSGSLVHLQLVQVQPGLCEIGSNQEENQTMVQELQQLLDRLKVHKDTQLVHTDTQQIQKDTHN